MTHKARDAGLVAFAGTASLSPSATLPAVVEQVVVLRRQRQTYCQISQVLPVGPSTIARLMRRAGLHRLAELEPTRPDNRYEYPAAGDLLHLDIKKLGRFWRPGHRVTGDRRNGSDGAGWEFVHLLSMTTSGLPSAPSKTTSAAVPSIVHWCGRCVTTAA